MSTPRISLLLAHADDCSPLLEEGLPLESAASEQLPPDVMNASGYLWDGGGDSNSLPEQRWGLIVPEGPRGDRLLSLIARLKKTREEQQGGAEARVYRVPSGMDAPTAARWKESVFRGEEVYERDLPRYLLLLGDLDAVSLELQRTLACDAFVGRLTFPKEEDFEAYVEKVIRWERQPHEGLGRSLFATVQDDSNSKAINTWWKELMLPTVEVLRKRQELGDFSNMEMLEPLGPGSWSADAFLSLTGDSPASLLFTISHGLGAPHGGWRSPERQRAEQGAMYLGNKRFLMPADVRNRPFLPGGFWLYIACFGAGTPKESMYHHWLKRLQDAGGYAGQPDEVLAALPRPDERPFTSAFAQAALANPEGPLAVVGHVDMAWTFGFRAPDAGRRFQPSRLVGLLRNVLEGRRAGVALGSLLQVMNAVNMELTALDDRAEAHRVQGRTLAEERMLRSFLWLLRQDMSAYVLLGDPAVRLPLRQKMAQPHAQDLASILGIATRG